MRELIDQLESFWYETDDGPTCEPLSAAIGELERLRISRVERQRNTRPSTLAGRLDLLAGLRTDSERTGLSR